MELALNKKYFNGIGEMVVLRYEVQKCLPQYDQGYRFKDSVGRFYLPTGECFSKGKINLDLTEEVNHRMLSDVAFDDIKIGDAVISFQGDPGKVVTKDDDKLSRDQKDPDRQYVTIKWDHGGCSNQPAAWLDCVRYLGQPTP